MLKLVIKTVRKELVKRKEVSYLEEQKRRKWREADELKEKAIEAYRNEKHAIGKMYMKKWDAAVDEILALNKKIRDLNKE